ncbi:MAG: glycosyltransferase [Acidimicrobiales bacterium]
MPEVSGSPLVCSVARLERYKGHDRLIAAMPALLELAPDAHLAVIGRGGLEPQPPSTGHPVAGRTRGDVHLVRRHAATGAGRPLEIQRRRQRS